MEVILVTNLNFDILCLCETFLVGKQEIQLSNYLWCANNRKTISRRVVRGSGGVGILVHKSILQHFTVQVLDNSFEDILWVQIMDNNGSSDLYVFATYHLLTPPEETDLLNFLTALKQIMEFHSYIWQVLYMWGLQC